MKQSDSPCLIYALHQASAFFVTRAKTNFRYKRKGARSVDKTTGLIYDQDVTLTGVYRRQDYPVKMRRIVYRDLDTNKKYCFLTNNFVLPALTIAHLYKTRWQVELFFKWIKQHLRIKAFYGTSENAVKTQLWIAVCTYVLIAIMKKHLGLERSLYTLLQILSISLFEKTPILQVFSQYDYNEIRDDGDKQLELFNF